MIHPANRQPLTTNGRPATVRDFTALSAGIASGAVDPAQVDPVDLKIANLDILLTRLGISQRPVPGVPADLKRQPRGVGKGYRVFREDDEWLCDVKGDLEKAMAYVEASLEGCCHLTPMGEQSPIFVFVAGRWYKPDDREFRSLSYVEIRRRADAYETNPEQVRRCAELTRQYAAKYQAGGEA